MKLCQKIKEYVSVRLRKSWFEDLQNQIFRFVSTSLAGDKSLKTLCNLKTNNTKLKAT